MSNNSEIRLMANDSNFVSIDGASHHDAWSAVQLGSASYGSLYEYDDTVDTETPWWEQGVLVSYEDIIAAERGEFDDYEW